MNKLYLLDELIVMINTGEITLEESAREAERILLDIKNMVEGAIYDEIVRDITDLRTEYYAPEYPSWKHFLADCNGHQDYEAVLNEKFEEGELESLWQNSHIAEELTEKQIKQELALQVGQLKMLVMIKRAEEKSVNPELHRKMLAGMEARIKGLYNMLYE